MHRSVGLVGYDPEREVVGVHRCPTGSVLELFIDNQDAPIGTAVADVAAALALRLRAASDVLNIDADADADADEAQLSGFVVGEGFRRPGPQDLCKI